MKLEEHDSQIELINGMLERDKDVRMAKKQLKLIGYGGIISALFRFSETIGSYLLIKLSDDYV
jgi:hypothetical protein